MSMSQGYRSAIGCGHALLEPVCPDYTTRTLRRAFIVWLHTGQQNDFQQVCNYFHRLESLESKMSKEQRAVSRLHEYTLVVDTPPSTTFVNRNFPRLYAPSTQAEPSNLNRLLHMRVDDCVFDYDGFDNMRMETHTTAYDIFKDNALVRQYCRDYSKLLPAVYSEFQDFLRKTGMIDSVRNLVMYIRKKYLRDEMVLAMALPKDQSYLNIEASPRTRPEKMSFRRLIKECRKQETVLFSSEFNSPKTNPEAVNPEDLPSSVRSFIYGI